jgi:Arylsulfotransferase (ASST)
MTEASRHGQGLTRRGLLKAGGGLVLGAGAIGLAACSAESGSGSSTGGAGASTAYQSDGQLLQFRSRRDLHPVGVEVVTNRGGTAPGPIILGTYFNEQGQQGPMIVDNSGELVWFRPLSTHATATLRPFNVRVQEYQGQQVLTWFQGEAVNGHGQGSYMIADSSYQTLHEVRAGNGYMGDLHEFLITDAGTALFTCYGEVQKDLTAVGGSATGHYFNGVVQEVDIATGKVLFQWRCDEHIGFAESYAPVAPLWDPFHVNSINVASDGNLIVSCRNAWTVYKIDRQSGKILWRLGGKKSDFTIGSGANFEWQHDVTPQPGGRLTVFDNGAGDTTVEKQSRGLLLAVDEQHRTVTLTQQFLHSSPRVLASALGSVQILPNGHVFMGWGTEPYASEYLPDGTLIWDLKFYGSGTRSYRAFRSAWTGRPSGVPALAVERASQGMDLYVSWNGDTEVRQWKVLLGSASDSLSDDTVVARKGFETAIKVPSQARYVAVAGLDADGKELGRSSVHQVPSA